jgi:hypothetical protein
LWKQEPKPEIQYNVICKKCQDLKCDQNCPKTVRLEKNKTDISGKNSSKVTGLERGHDYLFTVVGKIKPVNENYWNNTSKEVKLRGTKNGMYSEDVFVITNFGGILHHSARVRKQKTYLLSYVSKITTN